MTGFDPTQAFVLLDDVRSHSARLFTGLRDTIVAATAAEVGSALYRLRTAAGGVAGSDPGGSAIAGFIGFEAGYALEPQLATALPTVAVTGLGSASRSTDGLPQLWFGRFATHRQLNRSDGDDPVDALLAGVSGGTAAVSPAIPSIDAASYIDGVEAIKALIAAGDIYQANLTFAASVASRGHPLALYRRLRRAQSAPYSALVHTGSAWVLSFSPELFFALSGGKLTTRPMKGTAARGGTRATDDTAAETLAADPKNRAENLMIVDLLRNDLSRVAVPGSVAVPALFAVERYPTLLQMTSTITATARNGVSAVDVIEAIFPCGSITGAPKIRAMEVIAATERGSRGLYTGSIGWIGADGDAGFNVAIRTLVMTGRNRAQIGLGAGIVADSDAASEWRECLSKAAFLTRRATPDLIETMRVDGGRVPLLARHLARLVASAAFLGHHCDREAIHDAVIAAAIDASSGTARLRLLLAPSGALSLQLSTLPPTPPAPVVVVVAPLPVPTDDWRLRHKTSDRDFYDDSRRAAAAVRACFEVVFARPDGQLTEGSFTSLFVPRADGILLTPPAAAGLLPSVLRAELLATGRAVEAPLTATDLTDGFFVGNALRGLMSARLREPSARG